MWLRPRTSLRHQMCFVSLACMALSVRTFALLLKPAYLAKARLCLAPAQVYPRALLGAALWAAFAKGKRYGRGFRRAGYYEYHNADAVQARAQKQAKRDKLVSSLKQIRAQKKKYGVNRLRLKLLADNKKLGNTDRPSYGKIYRLCSQNGLLQKTRIPKGITKQDPKAQASDDLLKRNFTADAPNKKWLGDISEVACKDGVLYIAPVMDCFNGAIVGLSMDNNKRAELLCKNALDAAVMRYGKSNELIFHSDRGSQYTSNLCNPKERTNL